MLFFGRPRDQAPPYFGCLGTFLIFAIIAAAIAICVFYFGLIILGIFIGFGILIGLIAAIIAYIRALPDSINDVRMKGFRGSRAIVLLKKLGYFHICLIKYSMRNAIDYFKKFIAEFSARKFKSFTKWMYLALAITTLVGGVIILGLVLLANVLIIFNLCLLAVELILIVLFILINICLWIVIVMTVKDLILGIRYNLWPIGLNFAKKHTWADALNVLKTTFSQVKNWFSTSYSQVMTKVINRKNRASGLKWYSPKCVFAFALWLIAPVAILITMLHTTILLLIVYIPCYIVNFIWIAIKSIF